ncbi:hypothetical protein AMTRI_Chr03g50680 [Amborella trichopoda]
MGKYAPNLNPGFVFCAISVCLCVFAMTASAKSSRRPVSDYEIKEKTDACYADIESGLWGWNCKSSMIAKENCVLRCLSPDCYEFIYAGDPLEEGEIDYVRSQEYKYCMHNHTDMEGIGGVRHIVGVKTAAQKVL